MVDIIRASDADFYFSSSSFACLVVLVAMLCDERRKWSINNNIFLFLATINPAIPIHYIYTCIHAIVVVVVAASFFISLVS